MAPHRQDRSSYKLVPESYKRSRSCAKVSVHSVPSFFILSIVTVSLSLIPSWLGLMALRWGATIKDHPPFWYLSLVSAFTSLAFGAMFGAFASLRTRFSPDARGIPAFRFLQEDWIGRLVAVGSLCSGVFALSIGMTLFHRATAYKGADGLIIEAIGLGMLAIVGIVGLLLLVLWQSCHIIRVKFNRSN